MQITTDGQSTWLPGIGEDTAVEGRIDCTEVTISDASIFVA